MTINFPPDIFLKRCVFTMTGFIVVFGFVVFSRLPTSHYEELAVDYTEAKQRTYTWNEAKIKYQLSPNELMRFMVNQDYSDEWLTKR